MKKLYLIGALTLCTGLTQAKDNNKKNSMPSARQQQITAQHRQKNMAMQPQASQSSHARFAEYERISKVVESKKTKEQKDAYLAGKAAKPNFQPETPEFRFAIKLEEYYRKLLSGEMTIIEFIEKVSQKIANYFENKKSHIHHAANQEAIAQFLDEYLSMPLKDLQNKVGKKDEDLHTRKRLGRMQRFVNE